jgi:uncharacterized protein
MRNMKLFAVLLGLVLCYSLALGQMHSFHEQIPDAPNPARLVNDFAGMMNASESDQLEAKLEDFEKKTSNEIVVVTIASLQDLEVDEFALELGRKWNIGKASKKNGVLILAAQAEHRINISPAYGLQGALPDMLCARIIREFMTPAFKKGQFYSGFDQAADAVIAATKGEFTNDTPEKGKEKKTPPIFIFILFIILLIYLFVRRNSSSTYVSRRGYRNIGGGYWGGGFGGFGGFGGGGGNSDGGFGGFGGGGGGFDGGGSSGGW